MESLQNKIKEKILPHIQGKYANFWLFMIAFAESSFFPVPPDVFLLPAVAANPSKWKWFSGLVTVASVLGALLGYFIGLMFFDAVGARLISAYGLEDAIAKVGELFNTNAFWAMFTSAFTPIPYKIFTVAGGLFKVDLLVFITASILGRGMRFYAVGYLSKMFGERAGQKVFGHFNFFTVIFALAVLIYALFQFV